jgi:GntR family transcriptional regulator
MTELVPEAESERTAALSARLPKSHRLKEELLETVGRMPPGSPIASERLLSERYGVSRATVRQALQDLMFEGRLYRLQGRGTFVARPKLTQTLRLTSHTREMESSGLVPGSVVLGTEEVKVFGEVAAMLELGEGTPALKIERLRLANDEPMALESLYVDAARFPGLDTKIAGGASFYGTLRDDHGIRLHHGEETIECVLASPWAAALLAIEPRSPMLKLTRRSWTRENTVVEYVESLYRGDRYRFSAPLALPDEQAAERP